METLQSTIFIEFDVNTKKITFLRGDNIVDYDSNITSVYVRVKYKNLSGNTVYLTPSELEDYKFSLYTIKPLTNNVNLIRGEVTDELKENVNGGVVKFEIPRVCTNRLGIVKCEIHINQGNKIIGSSTFVLDVKQSLVTAFDDELLGDEDFPVLKQLILEIQKDSNIDDNHRSKITTYSSDKIENIKEDLSSQIENTREDLSLQIENNTKMIELNRVNSINSIKYIGHKGYSDIAPENTLPSFEKCGIYGFWGCECDLRETSDGKFVIIHDSTIDRTMNGTGNVCDFTLAQLRDYNIDYGNNISKYNNIKIPTLEEYLLVCKKYGMKPIIEVKSLNSDNSYENLINQFKKYYDENEYFLMSDNETILRKLREINKNISLGFLCNLNKSSIDWYPQLLGEKLTICSHYGVVTKELVEYAHTKGVKVLVWTVDDVSVLNNMVYYGVDYIVTNKLHNKNNFLANVGDLQEVSFIKSYGIECLADILDYLFNICQGLDTVNGDVKLGSFTNVVGTNYDGIYIEGTHDGRCFMNKKRYVNQIKKINVTHDDGIVFTVHCFDSDGNFISDMGWLSQGDITLDSNTSFFTLYFKNSTDTTLTSEDIEKCKKIKVRISLN